MAGKVGNPYHDPSTGKFTSGSGLNVANSTRGQRIKAHVKTAAKAAGAFGLAVGAYALGEVAKSALSGVTHVVKRKAATKTHETIVKYSPAAKEHAANIAKNVLNSSAVKENSMTKKLAMGWKIVSAPQPKVAGTSTAKRSASVKSHIARQHVKDNSGYNRADASKRTMVVPGTFPYRKG